MKHNLTRSGFLALALGLSLLAAPQAEAAVVITNLQLTTTTMSFDVSGTLPDTPPLEGESAILVINPNPLAFPGFELSSTSTFASAASFTGSQTLFTNGALSGANTGDYIFFIFRDDLQPGAALAGTFSATWASPLIDPAALPSLDFYWGTDSNNLPIEPGVLLSSVPVPTYVPEPSGAALLLCGLATMAARRRRR